MMKLNLAIILAILFFTSCQEDSVLNPTVTPPQVTTTTPDSNNSSSQVAGLVSVDSAGCYEIVFPITFVYEDGTTEIANSEDDFLNIFAAEPFPVDFAYPLYLLDPATGLTATANDETELFALFSQCDGYVDPGNTGNPTWCDITDVNYGFIACYDLVFPVSFVLTDGTTATVQSLDDLPNVFTTDNPPVDFAYPINLVGLVDGQSYTAATEDELNALILACDGWTVDPGNTIDTTWCDSINVDFGFFGCYDLVFPVTFILTDGTSATAQSEDDLLNIFTSNNPPADFAYPINLIGIVDGQSYSAANEDELEALFLACSDFPGGGGGSWGSSVVIPMTIVSISQDSTGTLPSCYTYNYPVSVNLIGGGTETANDDNEMLSLVFGGTPVEDFVYPLSVTEVSSGNTLTANDEAEVVTLIDDCD